MPNLTYQEKSLYGVLALEVIIYGGYFLYAANTANLGRLIGAIFLAVVATIIYQIVLAIASRSRVTDERDRMIEALGYRSAYFALVTGLMGVIALEWTHASMSTVLLTNVLFGALVLAEVWKLMTQLALYRRPL